MPRKITKTIEIDFPEASLSSVYTGRIESVAGILNVEYSHRWCRFGPDQMHVKITLTGSKDDVERTMEFINKSIELFDNDLLLLQ